MKNEDCKLVLQEDKVIFGDRLGNYKYYDMNKTIEAALELAQIEEKMYEASLLARGISKDNIYKYGFAFEGKRVLIEKA